MHLRNGFGGVLAFILALLSPAVSAAPEKCTNGLDNGHYYEVIPFGDQAWDLADADAGTRFFTPPNELNALQGHLATITSADENECVNLIRLNTGPFVGGQLWLGGSQAPLSVEPGEGWSWVNNEGIIPGNNFELKYANWFFGEPNNQGSENHLTMGLVSTGEWNDSIPGVGAISGYIIEYDGTVPAETCVDDGSPLPPSCNPAGVQETTFPQGTVTPPGSTYTQTILEIPDGSGGTLGAKLRDPRVNPVTGECFDRRRLDVFAEFPTLGSALGGLPGDLILSRFQCGSPDFAVLKSSADGFEILNGVVRSRQLPEEIFGAATFDCEGDVAPGGSSPEVVAAFADLQRRGEFVWQPDDKRDVIERRSLTLTNACGSRRGATKDLSFFVLNLHTDCGIEFGTNPQAVLQCFRGLTVAKFARLGISLFQTRANREISRSEYRNLRRTLARSRNQFIFGNYDTSLLEISMFIAGVQAAGIAPSTDNFEGDLLMRAEHIEFTTMKIRDEVSPPIP